MIDESMISRFAVIVDSSSDIACKARPTIGIRAERDLQLAEVRAEHYRQLAEMRAE